MATPLRPDTLDRLDEDKVARPSYDRSQVDVGIVHFGVGGFHRAHQAMYTDALMNKGEALDWGICGVGTLQRDAKMAEVMADQGGLYTLVVKHPDGTLEPRVIGSIVDYLFAPEDPEAVLQRLCDPAVRIVSLTVTEGGYHVNPVTGQFDARDKATQEDLAENATPSTVFGFLTEALRRRREAATAPFTVMSCDNIPGNGDVARKMITAFAMLKDEELGGWIASSVSFPNCMVDRITPVTVDADREHLAEQFDVQDSWPVVCEPFTQWVLQDDFPDGRPAWQDAGVQIVEDVEPYELMKLRLLNVSHQALCYLGFLAGYTYAHEVCQDQLFVKFLLGYMRTEGAPTLPPVPGVDLNAYEEELIERFANPEVRDTLARLCAESSDRIPKWLVPVIFHQLDNDGPIDHSALVVAAWARYAEGKDEKGEPIEIVDRLKDEVMAAAAKQDEDPLAFLRNEDLFGDLAQREAFTDVYSKALKSLHDNGARATLEQWTQQ